MIKELTMEKTSLPVGWEMKTLGDISDFQRGLTYSRKDAVDFSENIVLRATNIDLDKSCLDFSELKYLNNDFQVKQNKKIVKGGLLICLSSGSKKHLGKVALVTDEYNYAFGGFIGQIIPDNQVVSKYLFYNLVSEAYKKYISELTDGIGINNLKSIDLKSFEIPLPPLPHHKQIVAILDKAFTAIDTAKANSEQNLQNAKELFESYLQNIFENKGDDWEEKTIGDIGKPSMCKRILKQQTTTDGDIPFYKIGTFGKTPNAYISKDLYEEYKTKYSFPKKGDILISASGTIGRRVIYDGKPAFFQDSNIVWIDNDEKQVLNEYLYSFYGFCDWQPSKGATISRLYNANLKRIKITFPKSLQEQKIVIQKIEVLSNKTKKLEAIYTQKIADLEEMKKSVLQKAFSGQLNTIN